jgi:Uncharacterized protein containing a von Willebrand factor type A (vWA) domain
MRTKRSVALATIVTIFLLLFLQNAAVFAADIEWDNPGAINLQKTATGVPGDEYAFKITLTVEGKNIVTTIPTKVVLVIDNSGSMRNDNRSANAKAAAAELVNILQATSSSEISIAAISYSETITSTSDGGKFYTFNEKQDLLNRISGFSAPNGGTNIQLGIKTASEMLTNAGVNGIIIVLTDGEPTYSYTPTATEAYTGLTAVSGATQHDFKVTAFNYNSRVGSGGAYDYTGITVGSYTVSDNGISTISEAMFAKTAGHEIYTVAVETPSATDYSKACMRYVMQNVATDTAHALTASSSDIAQAFKDIATQIAYAAQDGVVTDIMAPIPGSTDGSIAFEPVLDGSLPLPVASQGTVDAYDALNKQFIWHTGTIQEGIPATFTYYVRATQKVLDLINDGTIDPSTTVFDTNDSAVYDYTDVNGDKDSKPFPKPKVTLPNTRGMVYAVYVLVNENGEYIGNNGEILIAEEQNRPDLAKELGRKQILNDVDANLRGTGHFMIGESYNIGLPSDHGLAGYQLYGNNSRSVVPVNSETYVYFPFYAVPNKTVVLTFIAEEGGGFKDTSNKTVVQNYLYNQKVNAPVPVANPGWKFIGWDVEIPELATDNLTFRARFEKLPEDKKQDPPKDKDDKKPENPKTGDDSSMIIPIVAMVMAIVTIPAVLVMRRKRTNI